jgi:hypothetical protein
MEGILIYSPPSHLFLQLYKEKADDKIHDLAIS